MTNQNTLTLQQREKGLLNLIKDSDILGFNNELTQIYKRQLKEVQEQIKADKKTILKFNKIERGYSKKMTTNRHKNMVLESIWFKQGELAELINAVEGNEKEKAFDILFDMQQRGDLE